jgi:hypothetical protein
MPFPCSAAPDVRLGGLALWRIRRLQAFIEEHLSQSIHIVDLSGAVGLSVPHFSRAFGLSFGEPPHLYVIQRAWIGHAISCSPATWRSVNWQSPADSTIKHISAGCSVSTQGERRQLGVVSGVMRSGLADHLRRCRGSPTRWPTKAWKAAGPLQLEAEAPFDRIRSAAAHIARHGPDSSPINWVTRDNRTFRAQCN